MADYKATGSGRSPQHPPEAPAFETLQPSQHVRVFQAAANLNRGFDIVLYEAEQLIRLGQFRNDLKCQFAKSCSYTLEELRAWAIFEVTEDLHQRAQDDWARYGRLRLRWENKFRDPKDVLAEAQRLKKKLAAQAAKKRAKKQAKQPG